jgi:hypothetical protein
VPQCINSPGIRRHPADRGTQFMLDLIRVMRARAAP